MAPNLVDLVNEYYEAKKPYSQILREAHTTPPSPSQDTPQKSETPTAETSDMVQSQQEPQFSISPRIPNDEISDVLKRLEAAKIEYTQGKKASAGKKGKAPAQKTR